MRTELRVTALVLILAVAACGAPPEQGLRDSFSTQISANRFVKEFQRNGDDLTFSGPGPEGGTAKWRVHIDSSVVEANEDAKLPYKGTINASWYADGQKIEPSGAEANLPFELLSNGLSQVSWAFWDAAAKRWTWE